MFNFSANHLFLLSRTEYRKCAVFLLRDLDTQRVYRLYDFTKALLLRPGVAYSVAGRVNSADKLHLVIESVRLDTKHSRHSNAHAPFDGAIWRAIGMISSSGSGPLRSVPSTSSITRAPCSIP